MNNFKVKAVLAGVVMIITAAVTFGQNAAATKPTSETALPKVTQVDAAGLQKLLRSSGKPMLINFWATWCDPCREEFPDLVKLAADYKGKIDLITISLDDLEEINTGVPKFLASMKAEMPAYLLKTPDEGAAIAMIAKDWQGGLPFTILLDEKGTTVYFRQGKIKPETVREKIDAVVKPAEQNIKTP